MQDLRLNRRTVVYDPERDEKYEGPGTFRFPNHVAEQYLERDCWEKAEEEESGSTLREDEESIKQVDMADSSVAAPSDDAERAADVVTDDMSEEVVETMEAQTPESESESEEENELPDVDLDEFLSQNAKPVRDAIRDGQFDDQLDTLYDIESATRDRKTVLEAIEQHRGN